MDSIAKSRGVDRVALFRRTESVMAHGCHAAIVEKDFWGCWALRRIFEVLQFRPHLIFKVGTSLSKVYRAIDRFSEDVDLSLSRRDLGFADDRDPEQVGISKTEARRRLEALVADAEITPYAAEAFPDLFKTRSCQVRTLAEERTFWEKATLLHAEWHRPADKLSPERLARHYYDLYRLARQPVAEQALGRHELLERVVAHKTFFFAQSWAHYETARPGTLRLLPAADRLEGLRRDHQSMESMIFGDAPEWNDIVRELEQLETRINGMDNRQGGG